MTTSSPTSKLSIFSSKCLASDLLSATILQLTWSHVRTDAFFENVCELDLVFNFYKVSSEIQWSAIPTDDRRQVYAILDEIFLAGEIEETSKEVVLSRLDELEKLEW